MIWFGKVLWHINHCGLFNAKSCSYIYIKHIWSGLVGFYGISTIVGYLMPNLVFTYILTYMICKHIFYIYTVKRSNSSISINLIQVNKVKQFQVLLCITNNSINHQSFVYTQLSEQTVLVQAIQFSMSFVCTLFKSQTVLFDP